MCVSKCRQLAANNAVKLIRFFDWLLLANWVKICGIRMGACTANQNNSFYARIPNAWHFSFPIARSTRPFVRACVRPCVRACPSYFNTLACLTRENS